MNKLLLFLVFGFISKALISQDLINMRNDFIPNKVDSNNFLYSVGFSYMIPKEKEETTFQKSIIREDAIQGKRLSKAKMEMVLFPSTRYENDIHPHVFLRLDFIPSAYVSSRFGAGISSKQLGSSIGGFYGTYYRRVPYEANFITRRKRSFENYNLGGLYLQSSSDEANFFFSIAFEKTHKFISSRTGFVVGRLLDGQKLPCLKTTELVMSYESLSGFGLGASIFPVPRMRLEVLGVVPDKEDVFEQARLQTRLAKHVLVSLSYFVD